MTLLFGSWGFFAHRKISHLAVFTLPQAMIKFYKNNISYITEHASDPDKRRYIDPSEAPRHYLDSDHYGSSPFDSLPMKWNEAVKKYTLDTLKQHGLLPWQIQRTYASLTKAFKDRDSVKILRYSSDLGHYIADAHVPLHTTQNHNGQLTNQVGIHAFWETRLPVLFSQDYDFFTGRAVYIEDPLKEAWKIIKHTFSLKDSVLLIEAKLFRTFPSDRKYSYFNNNGKAIKQYSEEYSEEYHKLLDGMVERQMRSSVLSIGSYWYSAWVDAGQPELSKFKFSTESLIEKDSLEKAEALYKEDAAMGRPEY
ncbi:zinc dependent phospholipase C family protein [Desertivirga arenae]|uniref:zinc dependent phospholipase C family protein n=1 Tax=Desertivirga arenae TaxID=2810309 RepID=UPI001F625BF9|nr:zinc dependent phospholipase C family protein [Pedobacter sp. SYSU D00823]